MKQTLRAKRFGFRGFTLIELMIGVAIVGILAAVVYPSYSEGVNRSRRAEGMAIVAQIANLQEQYYADNRTYTTDMTDLGFSTDPHTTENGYYSVDVVAVTAISADFIVTATAAGLQATNDGRCTSFSLDNLGRKTAKMGSDDNSDECWEK